MNRYPFHILLLSAFPVIYLYSLNADETHLSQLLRASAVLLICAAILWLMLKFTVRDGRKAGLVVSFSILYCFSYGPITASMYSMGLCPIPAQMRIRYVIVWILIYLIAVVLLLIARRSVMPVTRIVNIVAICLVATSNWS